MSARRIPFLGLILCLSSGRLSGLEGASLEPARFASTLPVTALFAAESGQAAAGQAEEPARGVPMNVDASFGIFIPLEGAPEEFDVGGTVDFKFQRHVLSEIPVGIDFAGNLVYSDLYLGAEFAFAFHDKDTGHVLSEGDLRRLYFLIPIELDIPIGEQGAVIPFEAPRENPFSIRFGIAPGLQIALPFLDKDLEDDLDAAGLDLDEDVIYAFNIRVRLGLRMPITEKFGFLLETAYDWARGPGKAELDGPGVNASVSQHDLNLSGLSIFLGFSLNF